ncbi:MAG: glycosyltransferase family 4 protein [Actinomycetota bacterium]
MDARVSGPSETGQNTVVFVSFAKALGGSTKSLANLLALLPGGVKRVLAAPSTGKFPSLTKREGLVESHLVIWDSHRPGNSRAQRFVGAVRLALWARRNRRKLVAIHANGPEEINVAGPAALVAGVPLVGWIHAFDVSPWMRRLGPMWGRVLRSHRVRWAAVSPTAGRVLTDSGIAGNDQEIVIIPNPIDSAQIRATSHIPDDVVRVAFLGSAIERKGLQLVPEIEQTLSDLPLRWVLFTGNERSSAPLEDTLKQLRALPSSRASIEGKIEDVREAYARCDIVFCPSLKESFCRVAAEAMMNGLPVVGSDIEPLRDLLGEEDAGLLFRPGDAVAAAAAIRRLVLDPELRHRLGREGRRRAAVFEPSHISEQLCRLYGLTPTTLTED